MPITKLSSALFKNRLLSLSLSLSTIEPHASDRLEFGFLWEDIRTHLYSGELENMIAARRAEIAALKEHWRSRSTYRTGTLTPLEQGFGAAYLFCETATDRYFIVKPVDEDIFCLNNHKHAASPFNDYTHRLCQDIPLYRSAQTAALAYETAQAMGLAHITPKTELALIASPIFFDIGDIDPDKEKLCSIQEYLEDSQDLWELVHVWLERKLTDAQIGSLLDPNDYEAALIFIWVIYDNDGHACNMRAYPKGDGTYGLKKIDNGLAFPENNSGLFNFLALLPQAQASLSPYGQALIATIPVATIVEKMHFYEMENCIDAFVERAALLQSLSRAGLSIAEIDARLCRARLGQ